MDNTIKIFPPCTAKSPKIILKMGDTIYRVEDEEPTPAHLIFKLLLQYMSHKSPKMYFDGLIQTQFGPTSASN